jgi:hypothetical protein
MDGPQSRIIAKHVALPQPATDDVHMITLHRMIPAIAVVAVVTACATLPSEDADDGTRVFAPGVVSAGNVYRGTWMPDGSEFYFFKKVGAANSEDYRIFVSRRIKGGWSEPDTVDLGPSRSDLYPAIDPTGRFLVFSSYRRAPGDTARRGSAYLWVAQRRGDGWGPPRFAEDASVFGQYHAQLGFDAVGRLHFVRQSGDYNTKIGEFDTRVRPNGTLERARPSDTFAEMKRLAGNLAVFETVPGWDGTYHIVVAAERDAMGHARDADLYISEKRGLEWTALRRLDINSKSTDNFPFFSPDGRRLYFVRDFKEIRWVPVKSVLKSRD